VAAEKISLKTAIDGTACHAAERVRLYKSFPRGATFTAFTDAHGVKWFHITRPLAEISERRLARSLHNAVVRAANPGTDYGRDI